MPFCSTHQHAYVNVCSFCAIDQQKARRVVESTQKCVYLTLASADSKPVVSESMAAALAQPSIPLYGALVRNRPEFVFPVNARISLLHDDRILCARWMVNGAPA